MGFAETPSEDFLHPAGVSLSVESGSGRPCVTARPGDIAPRISIAHCEDRAVAVAQSEDVGVDIERIAKRDAATVEAFVSNSERILIDLFSAEEFNVCCTRLWCSKEAIAKLLGVGVGSLLRALEMTQVERSRQSLLEASGKQPIIRGADRPGRGFHYRLCDAIESGDRAKRPL